MNPDRNQWFIDSVNMTVEKMDVPTTAFWTLFQEQYGHSHLELVKWTVRRYKVSS